MRNDIKFLMSGVRSPSIFCVLLIYYIFAFSWRSSLWLVALYRTLPFVESMNFCPMCPATVINYNLCRVTEHKFLAIKYMTDYRITVFK